MTSCTGCNVPLGWKKYNFQKQWRVHGYFCRECMKKMGQDFDDHGRITMPKTPCSSCHQEFYFLESVWHEKKQRRCCNVCKDARYIDRPSDGLPPIPPRIPMMMAIFAAFGVLLMIAGFVYVLLVAPQQDSSLLHVIIGSCMSGAGFMLARKMVKVRNLILGKSGPIPNNPVK